MISMGRPLNLNLSISVSKQSSRNSSNCLLSLMGWISHTECQSIFLI
jgi:hypothetical protein